MEREMRGEDPAATPAVLTQDQTAHAGGGRWQGGFASLTALHFMWPISVDDVPPGPHVVSVSGAQRQG